MYKLVIFDLDGTLLDTLPDIYAVLNGSLRKFGFHEITLEKTKSFVGNGAKNLVRSAVGDSPCFDEVYNDYSVRFPECGNVNTAYFKDEIAVLKHLQPLGIKFAVITNKPQRATENVMRKFFPEIKFDFIIGQSEQYPLKPDPASTLSVIGNLRICKGDCLFVGDGETDVKTAHAAGIDCVSVLWGYRSMEELKAAGAICFADSWKKLQNFILKS